MCPRSPSPLSSRLDDSQSDDEDGEWLDLEAEEQEEVLGFQSFFSQQTFSTLDDFLQDSKQSHAFDFQQTAKKLGLDFYDAVKLVNYLRSCAQNNQPSPSLAEITRVDFADEKYLQPVLENDAVLFSLDEILQESSEEGHEEDEGTRLLVARNKELEENLETLRNQFLNYRLAVQHTLDQRWGEGVETGTTGKGLSEPQADQAQAKGRQKEEDRPKGKGDNELYFESYAGNDIHEAMLKDSIRTDAYRDFIYENKTIFQGKVVLDIGCGTGILSMFAAKAGAKQVFAIDNSSIIHKARANIFHNSLSSTISTFHSAVEEVTLPEPKVDIIISEWMGYCLLYEAMLPSVLFARDKFLAKGGVMVPSSATLWIAPIADKEWISERVGFWRDVYGFDMKAMQEGIYDEVRVEVIPEKAICGKEYPFRILDLNTVKTGDLSFVAQWETLITHDVDNLDGFVIWFDNFFATSGGEPAPDARTTPDIFAKQKAGNVAFTTGPYGKETHWRQGVLMIPREDGSEKLLAGTKVTGTVEFSIAETYARGLDLSVKWTAGMGKAKSRVWKLQ